MRQLVWKEIGIDKVAVLLKISMVETRDRCGAGTVKVESRQIWNQKLNRRYEKRT